MLARLDEERLELLRRWGSGLATESRDELRAAGKAILLLIDEIEHLQVDVWNARVTAVDPDAPPTIETLLLDRLPTATHHVEVE